MEYYVTIGFQLTTEQNLIDASKTASNIAKQMNVCTNQYEIYSACLDGIEEVD